MSSDSEIDPDVQAHQQLKKDKAAWRADPARLAEIVSAIRNAMKPYETHARKRLETSPNLKPHHVPLALELREAMLCDDGPPGCRKPWTDPPVGASESRILADVRQSTQGHWCWKGISEQAIQDGLCEAVRRGLVRRFTHEGREHFKLSESLAKDDGEAPERPDLRIHDMPQSLRSKVDELADLIFGIIQAAELAKPIGRQPAEWTPAVVEFPKSIDRAIDGVGLLDGFGRPVGGVELPVWLDGLRAALLQLKTAYLTHGHKLFGERAGVLHPLLKAVSRYSSDLRRLHVSQDTDAVKPKAAHKPREPAKRRKRIPRQTERQREALDIYGREKTFAAVAKHFDITDTGARDLVLRAKATIEAIAAETKRLLAERSSGRSVKPDQKLPEDKRGQAIVSDFKRQRG